jgi:hypothetical protein
LAQLSSRSQSAAMSLSLIRIIRTSWRTVLPQCVRRRTVQRCGSAGCSRDRRGAPRGSGKKAGDGRLS